MDICFIKYMWCVKGCEYGDRQVQCMNLPPAWCYNVADVCCQTCPGLKTENATGNVGLPLVKSVRKTAVKYNNRSKNFERGQIVAKKNH